MTLGMAKKGIETKEYTDFIERNFKKKKQYKYVWCIWYD